MAEHILKTRTDPFRALESGAKRFEFRKNDRQFQVGDILVLRMYDPNFHGYSTGGGRAVSSDHGAAFGAYILDANGKFREMRMRVTYVLTDGRFGVPEGFCVMSLDPVSETKDGEHG